MRITSFVTLLLLTFALGPRANSQIAIVRNRLPQPSQQFRVTGVTIDATIKDQVATVQMSQTFKNVSSRTLETQFVFPLPDDAAINGLTLLVDGKELVGELKPKDEARGIYEEIVRRQQDPALLEYMGRGIFKTSVFPIPAGQDRKVEIRYTQLLKNDNGLVDFTLPLSTAKHCQKQIEKVAVNVRIRSKKELKNLYSPTHDFDIERPDDSKANCTLNLANVSEPDDVRLLFGTKGSDIGIDVVSYQPDGDEQGYFLVLASPKVKSPKTKAIPKSVLFVVDRSGSMAGEKIKQARASLRYMINSLGENDTFNVISYSATVDSFRPELEEVNEETIGDALSYVDDLYAGGGTNINEALTEALKQLKDDTRPNYVLFFTDGLPTVGEKSEMTIARNASKANEVNARVFSFGVGYDVNSRLLDRLASDQRGSSVYVKPEEDIEVAASNLFRKVSSPAMTNVKLVLDQDSDLKRATNRIYPGELPDLFHGEQLVVVGRYKQPGTVAVSLKGNVAGKERTLTSTAEFGDARSTRKNGFVESLWATRRIGEIIDELDLSGHNKELVDELVALSLKHGIMTPYTSFLAEEDVSLNDRRRLLTETESRSRLGLSMTNGVDAFFQRDYKQSLQNARRGGSAGSRGFSVQPSGGIGGGGAGAGMGFGAQVTPAFGGGGTGAGIGGLGGYAPATNAPARSKASQSASEQKGIERLLKQRFGGRAAGGLAAASGEEADTTVAQKERIKRVGTKTFYWKSGEWQAADVASLKELPKKEDIKTIEQFSSEYFELSRRDKGKWKVYLTIKEPVLLKVGDQFVRIVPAKPKTESNN